MRLLNDLAVTEQKLPRRTFLTRAAIAAVSGAVVGTATIGAGYLRPGVLFEAPSRFRALAAGDLARAVVVFLEKRKTYVVRDERGIFAMSAVCTHLGCLTRSDPGGDGFFCPCHGSRFARDGRVIDGPATEPLPHYRADVESDALWVDTAAEEDADARIPV